MVKHIFGYPGNKYRLLKHVLPLLKGKPILVDVFGGTGVVGLNSNSPNVIYNELNPNTFNILKQLGDTPKKEIFEFVEEFKKFNLPYIQSRLKHPDYNEKMVLYCRSYFKQIFNQMKICDDEQVKYILMGGLSFYSYGGQINVDYYSGLGAGVSLNTLPKRVENFKNINKNVIFSNTDFSEIVNEAINNFSPEEIEFYFDPPYLGTRDFYLGGTVDQQKQLDLLLLDLTEKGYHWVYSNNAKNTQLFIPVFKHQWLDIKYHVFGTTAKHKEQEIIIWNEFLEV